MDELATTDGTDERPNSKVSPAFVAATYGARQAKNERTMLPANHANRCEKIPEKEKIIRVHSRDSRAELQPATP
jgi:hypothetical protein